MTESTNALLRALLAAIRKNDEPDEPEPLSSWAKLKACFDGITGAVKLYWFWLPIVAFFIAWFIYRFNPVYFFEQYKIASDESAAKMAAIEYRHEVLLYYLSLGDRFLSDGNVDDAKMAYEEAQRISQSNLSAEFGLQKTRLLAFSEEQQFDPAVVYARLQEVAKLAPQGVDVNHDPHILFAKARFYWRTDQSGKSVDKIVALYKQAPAEALYGSSTALDLMAGIAMKGNKFQQAIDYLEPARLLSPYSSLISNNLAYAYHLEADRLARAGKRDQAIGIMTQNTLPLYGKTRQLDVELITPAIEIYRLKTLLERPDQVADLGVTAFIEEVEFNKRATLPKNQDTLFYILPDKGRVAINSWQSKKAYLLQLKWLREFFQESQPGTEADWFKRLENIQQAADVDGKQNLPGFLLNDLDVLELYHGQWSGQPGSACKIKLLRSFAQGSRDSRCT